MEAIQSDKLTMEEYLGRRYRTLRAQLVDILCDREAVKLLDDFERTVVVRALHCGELPLSNDTAVDPAGVPRPCTSHSRLGLECVRVYGHNGPHCGWPSSDFGSDTHEDANGCWL